LYLFLQKNNLEKTMYAAALQMLRMKFIKQSLPFAKISHQRLQWLADKVEEIHLPANTMIFNQGEIGDKCYLIRSGKVEIFSQDDEKQLAVLKSPALFGEATLITHTPRNALAKTLEETDLLVLKHEYLSELIETENNVANMFMTFMVDRSRPMKNQHVTVHQRTAADGQEISILKNPDNGSYFKLSAEGSFIWDQLDGKHTLQDMTLDLSEKFNVFAPDIVAALISKLSKSGFISNIEIMDDKRLLSQPRWVRVMVKVKKLLETRFTFGDADQWVTHFYHQYIKYLFTRTGQILLGMIAFIGFISFAMNTSDLLLFFSFQHMSLLLLLALVPLSLFGVFLHELGHAFAVKAFNREVHYIGVGWNLFAPVAFTDTSDMWLATRKPRIIVNLAGIFIDIVMAGFCSILLMVISNPYIQGLLWLFSLYTYIGAVRHLNPIQDMDGYYALMDSVDKNRLRQSAVSWLIKKFPQAIRKPQLFKDNWPEIIYWLACIIYIILISTLTLVLQNFVFIILDIKSNIYISLLLPFIVVVFMSLVVIADIKNQADE
ncbi:MAG: cyclic nucleotide-binding protein, partial [uncultured bacterium]